MTNFELIVGAGAGDEGKGTITARIAEAHKSENVLNVLTNGGSQRGHSVFFNGKTHVFKHFGAGTPFGAVTCFSNDFILNPIQFCKEYFEIESVFGVKPKAMRMPDCKWSTPWDMMYNQMDSIRHWETTHEWKGTCGMGIWATLQRYKEMPNIPANFDIFMILPEEMQFQVLDSVKTYYEQKIDVSKFSDYEYAWHSDALKQRFLYDCRLMFFLTEKAKYNTNGFSTVIFENGQGLLLGDTGVDDPEKTPSITGSKSIANLRLSDFSEGNCTDNIVTVHYVTRPYLTRHGSDSFVSETIDCDLNPDSETNDFNMWQRGFKYGHLNLDSLKQEIEKDSAWVANSKNWRYCLDVTHCDELDRVDEFKTVFGNGLGGPSNRSIALNFHDSPKIAG